MKSPSAPSDTKLSTNNPKLIEEKSNKPIMTQAESKIAEATIKDLTDLLASEKCLSRKKGDKIAELEQRILSLNETLGAKKSEKPIIPTEKRSPSEEKKTFITEKEYLDLEKEYDEKVATFRVKKKQAKAAGRLTDFYLNESYPLPLFFERYVKHRWFKPNEVFYEVPEYYYDE